MKDRLSYSELYLLFDRIETLETIMLTQKVSQGQETEQQEEGHFPTTSSHDASSFNREVLKASKNPD